MNKTADNLILDVLQNKDGWTFKQDVVDEVLSYKMHNSDYVARRCRLLAENSKIHHDYKKGKKGQDLVVYRVEKPKVKEIWRAGENFVKVYDTGKKELVKPGHKQYELIKGKLQT